MSIEYAENKVAEALKKAEGNKAKARKLVMTWLAQDHQLLLGLTALHLNGIVPYWIDRIERKESVKKTADDKAKTAAGLPEKEPKSFGEAMLRNFAGQKTAVFGLESGSAPLGKREASKRHIDAINLIAQASKTKKKD